MVTDLIFAVIFGAVIPLYLFLSVLASIYLYHTYDYFEVLYSNLVRRLNITPITRVMGVLLFVNIIVITTSLSGLGAILTGFSMIISWILVGNFKWRKVEKDGK